MRPVTDRFARSFAEAEGLIGHEMRLMYSFTSAGGDYFFGTVALRAGLSQRVMYMVSAVKICAGRSYAVKPNAVCLQPSSWRMTLGGWHGRDMGFVGAGRNDTNAHADHVEERRQQPHLWGRAVGVAAGLDVVADEAVPVPPGVGGVVDGQQARAMRRSAVGGPDGLRRTFVTW